MSASGFHHQFKAASAMSPLQFRKQLRLQEARRLMLGEHLDAASAGLRVGYDDASQFSREYKRLFGQQPGTREAGGRDVERLRGVARRDASSDTTVDGSKALFTRISIWPNAAATRSTALVIWSGLLMSHTTPMATPPAVSISLTVRSTWAGVRERTATFAPSAANRFATAFQGEPPTVIRE
jgi:AraC-like DNA-binding protein